MLDNAKLNLVDGSFSFTVKVKNDGTKKKFYLSSNDILRFCEHLNENRKIRLVTDEHTAIAYILQSLFGEDNEQGLTAGLGLILPVKYADIIVDYSYQDFGLFGDITTMSLSIGF